MKKRAATTQPSVEISRSEADLVSCLSPRRACCQKVFLAELPSYAFLLPRHPGGGTHAIRKRAPDLIFQVTGLVVFGSTDTSFKPL